MKYYFIINPASGKNEKKNIEERIHHACLKREISYEILYTKEAGDGKRIAREIDDKEECVVFSVGGDGNLNDVLNGVIGCENKILGNIPLGSGNDFYRTIEKYEDQYILSDVGIINGLYFINVACLGLDADVANNLDIIKSKKWIPVCQRYNASLAYTFTKYQYKKLRMQIGDFSMESEFTIIAVGNAQYYGGGYRIAPQAMIDDGVFDIYAIKRLAKPKILPLFLKLIRGKHETSQAVKKYRNEEITIDCEEEYIFNVDGEMLRGKHFEIRILKNAIKIFNDKNFIKEIIG